MMTKKKLNLQTATTELLARTGTLCVDEDNRCKIDLADGQMSP